MSNLGGATNAKTSLIGADGKSLAFGNLPGDDSSIGLGGMGYDEESQSVRELDTSGRRPPPPKPGYTAAQSNGGLEDSVQNIVGTEPVKKKKNKKKKKKSASNSEGENSKTKETTAAEKPTRQSNRNQKNQGTEDIEE